MFGPATNTAASPTPLTQTPLSIYRCPSDTGPPLNPYRLEPTGTTPSGSFAMSNYRAVCGTDSSGFFYVNEDRNGVMFQNSKVTFVMITDGTSNTVVMGENVFDDKPGVNKWASIWAGHTGLYCGSTGCGVRISDVMWHLDAASATINGTAPQAFSSRHSGGAYFGFADGSVRFFRQTGDPNVVKWLGQRDDGKVIQIDF